MKELEQKLPSDKETKMAVILDMLLSHLKEKIVVLSTCKNQARMDEFIYAQMRIFETRIFPIHKLNFMQYLPLYIISLAQVNEGCTVFGEKFISFLIHKAFNFVSKEHMSVRQQSWNYLSTFISRQNGILKDVTIVKALNIIT